MGSMDMDERLKRCHGWEVEDMDEVVDIVRW